ncbi:DUF4307 domain-containing protein [Lysinibacter sp. HNR]|uniref:DUF4307 domain-containing protein n=1 Tax=Lysinibacter sp. HNR TaxID=3031408 RepID=UPI002434B3C8|nr:DUF4307 domain-containing protein [Lysinibacter sp. HNR]WGD36850.1 DUF4307 domain-containing protein [Lysinibacter sp. HNR]
MNDYLEERYGKSGSRRLDKKLFIVLGAVFAVVLVSWVVWAGLNGDNGSLEFRNVGHSVEDKQSVSITFEVNTAPNTRVACALQALSPSYSVLGWKVVELPESTERTRQVTESLRTLGEATTGLAEQCWILR